MVIRHKDKDLVAAAANDGKLYLLDSASLGGADHKTPLHVTPKYTAAGAGGCARDVGRRKGTLDSRAGRRGGAGGCEVRRGDGAAAARTRQHRRLQARGRGRKARTRARLAVAQPRLAARADRRQWDGVCGVGRRVSSGRAGATAAPTLAQRAQRSLPAVLYVLDGATGKELWSSGKSITSFARAGLSAGGGQVYVVTTTIISMPSAFR